MADSSLETQMHGPNQSTPGWSANLTLPDYGRFARYSPRTLCNDFRQTPSEQCLRHIAGI
jgi:hypothetical protein